MSVCSPVFCGLSVNKALLIVQRARFGDPFLGDLIFFHLLTKHSGQSNSAGAPQQLAFRFIKTLFTSVSGYIVPYMVHISTHIFAQLDLEEATGDQQTMSDKILLPDQSNTVTHTV